MKAKISLDNVTRKIPRFVCNTGQIYPIVLNSAYFERNFPTSSAGYLKTGVTLKSRGSVTNGRRTTGLV